MSEFTAAHVAGQAAGDSPGVVSDAGMPGATVDRLLADFRAWLHDEADAAAAARAEGAPAEGAPAESAPAAPVDLATLVGQFTALRHEIHLQTRGVRAQQEQAGQALDALQRALDAAD